jgi:hypothetical protein
MKKGFWIIPVILLITASCAGFYSSPEAGYPPSGGSYTDPGIQQYPGGPQQYGQNEDSSYFYDRLSPYGDWVDFNPYGYVWTPRHMGYRWRPYSDGHWVWTDYGWTWIADQEWGDIPFHYGRWGWDNDIGWFWVPGTVWGVQCGNEFQFVFDGCSLQFLDLHPRLALSGPVSQSLCPSV